MKRADFWRIRRLMVDEAMADTKHNYKLKFAFLIAVFAVAVMLAFGLGRYPVYPGELIRILLSRFFNVTKMFNITADETAQAVVLNLRLPRVISAVVIGAGLSVAGASYQGMFRNPMVSPDVLGASSGAGFGAALAILFGMGWAATSASAFVIGLAAVTVAYIIGRVFKGDEILGLVLSGMMISTLFSSFTSFIKLIADTDSVLPAITYWLMGSLSSIRMEDLFPGLVPIIVGIIPLFLLRWQLNMLTVSEDEARSMGVNTSALRTVIIVCSTLITAACVAMSGLIGWVGLVIPNFCRMLFGHDNRYVIPASLIMGASYLLIVDTVARIIAATEVPIGILTSVIGAPVFIYLMLSGRRSKIQIV